MPMVESGMLAAMYLAPLTAGPALVGCSPPFVFRRRPLFRSRSNTPQGDLATAQETWTRPPATCCPPR
jgi:hypothetical protein